MFRVVHPHSVSDPAWIRGGNIKIRVRVRVNVNLILPLQSQLVIIDANMTKLAGDDVDKGGPGRDCNDLDYGLSSGMLSGLEIPIMKKRLEHSCFASLRVKVDVEIKEIRPPNQTLQKAVQVSRKVFSSNGA